MNKRRFPFHDSFRRELHTISSASTSMRIFHAVMVRFGLSQIQAQIFIILASNVVPVTFEELSSQLPGVSNDVLKRSLMYFKENAFVNIDMDVEDERGEYSLKEKYKDILKDISLQDLDQYAAVELPIEVIPEDIEVRLKTALTKHFPESDPDTIDWELVASLVENANFFTVDTSSVDEFENKVIESFSDPTPVKRGFWNRLLGR